MKKIIVLLLLISCANVFAKNVAKVNVAILRNNQINHGATKIIADADTNIIFEDERTYIEADLLESTDNQMTLRCLISTASAENRGALVVRGMPRLIIPMSNGLGMASLNCNGPDEQFMFVVSICPC